MARTYLITGLIGLALSLNACHSSKKSSSTPDSAHNSKNALDYYGVYTGTLPCADCSGMLTSIALNKDETYEMRTRYEGKSTEIMASRGTYQWNAQGSTITLKEEGSNQPADQYKVGENTLTKLDLSGKPITGNLASQYVLQKMMADELTNKRWKLIEINGKPVKPDATTQKEPDMTFAMDKLQVSGNGGCNGYSGSFILRPGSRIAFSGMISTMMACPDMSTETQLHKVFETADNYSINAKKDTLSLNKARMAPLARFAAQ